MKNMYLKSLIGILFVLPVIIGGTRNGQVKSFNNYDTTDPVTLANAFVDSMVANTSIDEKIGQLFFVPVNGSFLSSDSYQHKYLFDLIKKDHIGGIIFMRGDIYGQAVLTNKLQEQTDIPLWITQDMEFGAAMRISGATRLPPAMGIAASNNVENAYLMGKITAQEAKAIGVHQIFAPVLDVNNNPDNPVINIRSFSGDPQTVSDYGIAFMKGVQSEGLIATAKHFPGHGDTDTDSHYDLPVLDYDYNRLNSIELIPFRKAIESGIPSIMSAHISFPKISEHPEIPGTLDPAILKSILIDSLSFDGLIVTDGLEMSGVSSKFSPGNAVVKALKAGADVMLISPDIHSAIEEVKVAVQSGKINEERIEQSFRKIMRWKYEMGLFESPNFVDITKLDEKISNNTNNSIADRLARESITILKNEGDIIPIKPNRHPKILYVAISDDKSGNRGSKFARSLRDYHPDVTYKVFDKRSDDDDIIKILRDARKANLIIIGSFISLRGGRSIEMSRSHKAFLKKLLSLKKESVFVNFGNPYLVRQMTSTDAHVLAWQNTTLQMEAVAPALFWS